jgi:TonB family protein
MKLVTLFAAFAFCVMAQSLNNVRLVHDASSDLRLVHEVIPTYPPAALAAHMRGEVKVSVLIGVMGEVRSALYLSGPRAFKAVSLSAVRKWRYEGPTLNGEPIEREAIITLHFDCE